MPTYSTKWTTKDELKYLKGIGGWNDDLLTGAARLRQQLLSLQRYLLAAMDRVDWGEIDASMVLKFARNRVEFLVEALRKKEVIHGSR